MTVQQGMRIAPLDLIMDMPNPGLVWLVQTPPGSLPNRDHTHTGAAIR